MSRGYDRDYDADYSDVHQVPVEPMGFWGLSDRSRRWARQEDRWGSSERSHPRRSEQERWTGGSAPGPRDRDYGQRGDYGRDYDAGRTDRGRKRPVSYRPGDPRAGSPWQRHPAGGEGRGWGVAGPRRYGRDFQAGPGMSRSWPERWAEQGRERERPRRYDRHYRDQVRPRMAARREEIPWDIDRPSLEGPVPGYPERTSTDAWGVYRPAWFAGEAPHRRDRQERGAWSYGAQRRSMYEATGSRPREREGRDLPRRDRPGRWTWSD